MLPFFSISVVLNFEKMLLVINRILEGISIENSESGIYEISCRDCDQKYVGQTKRSIWTRFKGHVAHLKYDRPEKSSVAQHSFDNNHRIDVSNLKLIKNVNYNRLLDAFECIKIVKCKKVWIRIRVLYLIVHYYL